MGPMGHLLVGRDKKDSTADRDQLFNDLKERQIQAEKGEAMPICIFPEGATSNGTTILKFKRGAFVSERSVKPHYAKYWTMNEGVSPCHGDAVSFVAHTYITLHAFFTRYTVYEMPVFEPNEYFWKNHWDGKEERWVAFARAVRNCMLLKSGLKDTEATMEDRVRYKFLVRGKK